MRIRESTIGDRGRRALAHHCSSDMFASLMPKTVRGWVTHPVGKA
jgi:hypothetical protein